MKKLLALLLALVMILGLVACGEKEEPAPEAAPEVAPVSTPEAAPTEAPVQIEDSLVVYSTLTEEQLTATFEPFAEVYPDIEVEIVNGGAGELLARVEAEADAPQADIFLGGLADTDGDSYADLFEAYVSTHDDELITGAQSDNGFYNYTGTSTVCLCVNTELAAEMGLEIDSYEDLFNPELEGKIIMADPNSSSSAWNNVCNFMAVWGCNTEEAWENIGKLMPNLVIASSSSATFNSVADGEYVVGLTYEPGVATLITNGADNIEIVYPAEGTSSSLSAVAMIKGCAHPEAAKALIEFMMSADGQNAMSEYNPNSRRTNAGAVMPETAIIAPSDEIYWVERPNAELIAQREDILTRWNELYAEIFG